MEVSVESETTTLLLQAGNDASGKLLQASLTQVQLGPYLAGGRAAGYLQQTALLLSQMFQSPNH
jgi:hypothetical protein